ncbi:MAG: beta-L-arabinofuranosidase domain-containing protein [Leeuwenhoekiella sp.]
MKIFKLLLCIILVITSLAGSTVSAQNQSGDQILDGIGETALISRYVFDGDAQDWSRNNLHGKIEGNADFVEDNQFGKVLSLKAGSKAYIKLPGEALTNLESMSVTGWVYMRSTQSGQRIFDFGKDSERNLFVAPMGTEAGEGYQAVIKTENNKIIESNSPKISANKWVHFAVVVDVPSESLTTYINGEKVSESKAIKISLDKFFDTDSPKSNLLYIGKSLAPGDPYLDAKLHDLRLYRIPLNSKQISGIYNSALGSQEENAEELNEPETESPQMTRTEPPLYTEYLESVPDVAVETTVGDLPRIPIYLDGKYRDKFKGPKVRVIWPAPKDNSEVLKTGTYTVTGIVSGTGFQPKATITVKQSNEAATPKRKLETFDLNQVTLEPDSQGHNTKFIENRDKFINTLSEADPNSFLYMFRNAFGQEQPEGTQPLGVWDTQETKLRGHASGHYLTAIAQAYASTGYDQKLHDNFSQKMNYMINTLYKLSQLSGKPQQPGGEFVADPNKVPPGAGKSGYTSDLSEEGIRTDYWNWGEGYISAYPPDQFIMLENGASYGGQETQIWAPYYTLHKILAGLMDVYEVSGNEKALVIAREMSDWVYARLSKLPKETLITMWNSYIAGEYGGMNEAMARLYRITNEEKYLKCAQLFDNIEVFFGDAGHTHGLAKNVDTFRGKHANQHVPQIVGALEMYRDSDAPEYYRVADNFWHKVRSNYMYSIGGIAGASSPSNAECFTAEPATLYKNGFSNGGQNETCATYNMLKLTRNLFLYDQQVDFMDYYEQGLYNDILASVAEDSPANTYHIPLNPGSVKSFGNPNMTGFTCCNGTALESSTKLQNSIYFRSADNDVLYVNLYVPSTLNWKERDITVEQSTSFPYNDKTQLTIKGGGKFDLNVRVPGWAKSGFFVKINGKEQTVAAEPGNYLTLNRKWKDGDIVELRMPFSFYLDPVMDQPNIASLFYGPVLLAAQEPEPRTDWRKMTLDAGDISKSIKGDPETLRFTVDGIAFKPFFETYDRHSVYLDVSLK